MGRERGYPLGACGFPCDADYEDGSVPLQLPPILRRPSRRSAKRRLSPPGDRKGSGDGRSRRKRSDIISARRIVVRSAPTPSSPPPSAHRCAAVGLDRGVTRIGLEAGPLSQWLYASLAAAGFEMVPLVKAALSAMVIKTDRKDARGIAQLLRMGGSGRCHHRKGSSWETGVSADPL